MTPGSKQSNPPKEVPDFPEHLRGAVQTLRGSIIDLLASVDADAARPQELARRFELDKTLAWKISKIVNGSDPYAAVPHIPGSAGLRIFFGAMERAGALAEQLDKAREATTEFDRVVNVHTGDRPTLEIMTSDMLQGPARGERYEQSRKLAFQGNCGTLGVRARVQFSLNILAPNRSDATQCDLAQINGLLGFRRLRRDARWMLFRRERWTDEAPVDEQDEWEPLDPDYPRDPGLPIVREFCSEPLPDIDVIQAPGEVQYELPPGPVGNTAAFSCVVGTVLRSVGPAYGDEAGEHSEIGCNIMTPSEHLVIDLLVHRDFEWAMEPALVAYSRMDGGGLHAAARRDRNYLPVPESVHDLGWGTAALATTIIPRYSRLLEYTFGHLDWNPDDCRAFRVAMRYPPIPTAVLLRSELPVLD